MEDYTKEAVAEFIRKHLVELNKLMMHLKVPVMISPTFMESPDKNIYQKHFFVKTDLKLDSDL
ncbi:hypothetical protein [Aequorivita sinensis]|uniref:hypothetical protein n=1 Tax=Aequorivita sinensis TaxID=1382458 RepID=UPI001121387A|nr:hypothetical protein [Aequorivita sinensis]